jgi:copper(I)-binding protein
MRHALALRYGTLVVGLIFLMAAMPESVAPSIQIADPWVRETSEPRALLHVRIANTDRRADRLLRASTPIAKEVAIWDEQGKQNGGFRIPGRAEFVIGGDYPRIELIGLTGALHASASFHLLLVFEQAGKMTVDVTIQQ